MGCASATEETDRVYRKASNDGRRAKDMAFQS
jgi:hypothetical protein